MRLGAIGWLAAMLVLVALGPVAPRALAQEIAPQAQSEPPQPPPSAPQGERTPRQPGEPLPAPPAAQQWQPRASPAAQARRIKREILALYDGRNEPEPHLTRIHKYAEMPLNHLGFTVIYWDLEKGLPEPQAVTRFRGVLSWLEQPLARPGPYVRWASEIAGLGVKLVMLGEPGPGAGPEQLGDLNRLLGIVGLQNSGDHVDVTFPAQAVVKDAAVVEFERKLDPVLPGFPLLTAELRDVTAHLTLATTRGGRAQASVLIATSPRGGYALGELTIVYERLRNRVSWVLNPFRFFDQAFGRERFPVPDTTTLSGRRIYFSHIDGDGWNNVSEIEKYMRANTSSAEVVLKELIEPFPDLPVTVGLIAGDVDPEFGGDSGGRSVARRLFALPQVEVGSHTHTHPYNWRFFDRYSREEEVRLIERQQRVEQKIYDRAVGTLLKLAKKEKPQHIHRRYIAGSDDLPRTYMRRPFELDLEVEGSLRAAEQLAPPGKRAMLYQWSGDTTPFEGAVRATREAGVRNLNGGDSRLDMDYPSVAYVPPVGRPVGAERQIYAANSNENTYTNDWTGPYYAFRKLEETVHNTDAPRRLKPYNVYYHMYSGEKPAALEAVRQHLLAARSGHAPVAASYYAAIADSFYETEVREAGPGHWIVSRRGDLSTVRFDESGEIAVDHARSRGVIGERRHAGALYVALDSEVEEAHVVLRDPGRPADMPDTPPVIVQAPRAGGLPYLVESRWRLFDMVRSGCGLKVGAEGFGPGEMAWAGLQPGRHEVVARHGASILWRGVMEADAHGRAELIVGAAALAPLMLELSCRPAS